MSDGTIGGITRTAEPMWRAQPITYRGAPMTFTQHANQIYFISTQPGHYISWVDWDWPAGYTREDWECLKVAPGL